MLLDRGANIQEEDHNGQTALHISAQHGHSECVRMLLDRGVNPMAEDGNGQSAFDFLMLLQ